MKCAMVVFTLVLLVLKAWAGKITDDFEDGDFNGWRPSEFSGGEEAEWTVKNGKLIFNSENFCRVGSALAIGDKTWTDYEFWAEFSLKKTFPGGSGCWSPSLGIGIHSDIAETGTMRFDRNQWVGVFLVNRQPDLGNDGWNLKLCEVWLDGLALAPDEGEFVTEPRKRYTLRISSNTVEPNNENSVTTYQAAINDIAICDFNLRTPLGEERANVGGPFLYVRNAEVHFDNVAIVGESIPDIDVNDFVRALSVSRGGKLATTWGEIKQHR